MKAVSEEDFPTTLVYSRITLLSLRKSIKFLNRVTKDSHGSSHWLPPRYAWEKLALMNLLSQRRGQCNGQQIRSSHMKSSKKVTPTNYNRKQPPPQNILNRAEQLNIQFITSDEQQLEHCNYQKSHPTHNPSNCVRISPTM